MSPSKKERDQALKEEEIASLVNQVRDYDNEQSFIKLKVYLDGYIRLFTQKYHIPGCDADEIEQECLVALKFKAIQDFDATRGKFKSFALLCIRRHLFSLIKGNNQQKRRVLNQSLSLDEDRGSEEGETLSLINIIITNKPTVADQMEKHEDEEDKKHKLLSRLSEMEREVLRLYLKQYHYDEIVKELKKKFPQISRKSTDNALVRARSKAKELAKELDWDD